jgi:hypothetical protein
MFSVIAMTNIEKMIYLKFIIMDAYAFQVYLHGSLVMFSPKSLSEPIHGTEFESLSLVDWL